MGTRHITRVIDKTGNTVVSNYGQWDGYPMGQGLYTMMMMAEDSSLLTRLETNLNGINTVTTDEELHDIYQKHGFTISETGFISIEESEERFKVLPELHRDTGSTILKLIADKPNINLLYTDDENINSWCEYINTIDFQKNTFDIKTSLKSAPIYTISINNGITNTDVEEFIDKFKEISYV